MKTALRELLPKGGLFLCLWLVLWSAAVSKYKRCKKVKKNRCFLLKTAVLWWTIQDLNL